MHKKGNVVPCSECKCTAILLPKPLTLTKLNKFLGGLQIICPVEYDNGMPSKDLHIYIKDEGLQIVCENHGEVMTVLWSDDRNDTD